MGFNISIARCESKFLLLLERKSGEWTQEDTNINTQKKKKTNKKIKITNKIKKNRNQDNIQNDNYIKPPNFPMQASYSNDTINKKNK